LALFTPLSRIQIFNLRLDILTLETTLINDNETILVFQPQRLKKTAAESCADQPPLYED
jgi:hypothetical protein